MSGEVSVQPHVARARTSDGVRRRRDPERGNALVVAIIALTGLATLGGLTVLSVKGGVSSTGLERFQAIALYAAESGATAAMDTLRGDFPSAPAYWSDWINSNATTKLATIPGNNAESGSSGNLFTTATRASYSVTVLNNLTEASTTVDTDSRLIIRSVGTGPDGAAATVEWEVQFNANSATTGRPCPGYGQEGISEDGAGRNDCQSTIGPNPAAAVYRPGNT